MCTCVELNELKYLLVDKYNIVGYIINTHKNLENNPMERNVLCLQLGILRHLLEGSKQLVTFDYFNQNEELFSELIDILLMEIEKLNQQEALKSTLCMREAGYENEDI